MPSVALLKICSLARGVRKQANEWTAGSMPPSASAAGLGDHVLLGDAALDEALREALAERDQPAVEVEVGVERDEPLARARPPSASAAP